MRVFGLSAPLGLTLALLLSTGCASDGPVTLESQMLGQDAGFDRPGVVVINSAEELEARGSTDLIHEDVNYRRRSVVVLSLGQRNTGGYWAQITGVEREGDALIVEGVANRPTDDQATTQAVTHPYAAVVVPKIEPESVHPRITSVEGVTSPVSPGEQ